MKQDAFGQALLTVQEPCQGLSVATLIGSTRGKIKAGACANGPLKRQARAGQEVLDQAGSRAQEPEEEESPAFQHSID